MEESHNLPERLNRETGLRRNIELGPTTNVQYVGSSVSYPSGEGDSNLLREGWQIIRRHKGLLIVCVLACTLMAFLLAIVQTPIYQAYTSIEFQGLNENFLNLRDVDPNSNTAYYGTDAYVQTQAEILQDQSLIERVLTQLKLEDRVAFIYNPSRFHMWRKALGLPSSAKAPSREELVNKVLSNLTIESSPRTRIVKLSFDSPDPQLAAEFVNMLASEFIKQNLEARWATSQNTGEWLTRQMEDLKIKLEKSEGNLQEYARITGLMFTSEKNSVAEEKLSQLQAEVSRAQADRASRQSQYETAVAGSRDALPETEYSAVKNNQDKLTDLRRELAENSTLYAPTNYRVKRVQAQIIELEAALEKERTRKLERIRNEYLAARGREQLLQNAYNNQAALLTKQAEKTIHYNLLKREVDTNRGLYEAMLQKVKEAGIASVMSASNIRVLSQAKPPLGPYKPNLLQHLALGLFGGSFLGLMLIYIRERADSSVHTPGDLSLYLRVPELGVILSAKADPEKRQKKFKSPLPKDGEGLISLQVDGSPVNSALLMGGQGGVPAVDSPLLSESQKKVQRLVRHSHNGTYNLELITWLRRSSLLAECFRATLTSLLYSGDSGSDMRVIAITSCTPMEGKTTLVSNLGIALAEINRSVLLIDADLRRPRLHKIFNLTNELGLADLLRERTPVLDKPFEFLVQKTQVPGLHVLSSGSETLSISNLLNSSRLPELLKRFRHEFNIVLIDTPPMLQLTDARVLGRLSDGVMLVVRASKTARDMVLTACQRFEQDGTRVIGTVLNGWDPKKDTGYGYGYSQYSKNYYTHYGQSKET